MVRSSRRTFSPLLMLPLKISKNPALSHAFVTKGTHVPNLKFLAPAVLGWALMIYIYIYDLYYRLSYIWGIPSQITESKDMTLFDFANFFTCFGMYLNKFHFFKKSDLYVCLVQPETQLFSKVAFSVKA